MERTHCFPCAKGVLGQDHTGDDHAHCGTHHLGYTPKSNGVGIPPVWSVVYASTGAILQSADDAHFLESKNGNHAVHSLDFDILCVADTEDEAWKKLRLVA
jgi:hypothetical protein